MTSLLKRRAFLGRLLSSGLTAVGVIFTGRWLSGPLSADATACVRPPGALHEKEFLAACIRCGRCADACPNRCIEPFTEKTSRLVALKPGRSQRNTPVIFPRQQACMLCNGVTGESLLCTAACPTGALQLTMKTASSIAQNVHMGTATVDTNLCYSFNGASCGICIRACPLEGSAIRAGLWEKPLVNADACIGCGLCERACVRYPQAIRVQPRNAFEI